MTESADEGVVDAHGRAARAGTSTARLVAATAVLWAILIGGFAVVRYGGDLRGLFLLGADLPHPAAFAGAPTTGAIGYDGQFFGALATDPLLLDPATPQFIERSLYRAGRVGLPLLAWSMALGNARLALILYQLLCWTLAVSVVWVAARWLEERGRSPLWAAPLAIGAGLVSSVVSSLPDAAAAALLLLALYLHRARRPGALAILCFACLTRETGLVVAAAIAASELRARRIAAAVRFAALPLAIVLGWRFWVVHRGLTTDPHGGAFGVPLAWIPERLAGAFPASEVLGFAAVGLAVVAVGALRASPRDWTAAEMSYAGFVLLAFVANGSVYEGIWSSSRVLIALPVLATVLAGEAAGARRWILQSVPVAFAAAGVAKLAPEILGRIR